MWEQLRREKRNKLGVGNWVMCLTIPVTPWARFYDSLFTVFASVIVQVLFFCVFGFNVVAICIQSFVGVGSSFSWLVCYGNVCI